MVTGKVNESLSRQLAYKGADGLTDVERKAYAVCRQLSCAHEACYKRLMYSSPKRQTEECGPLMSKWKDCFADEMKKGAAPPPAPPPAPPSCTSGSAAALVESTRNGGASIWDMQTC